MSGYNFMRGYTDDQNKASYGGDGYSDHMCRPVIIDAEGRIRPIIAYSAHQGSENYVTEHTERIVEHIRAPVVWPSSQVYDRPEYRHGSPPRVEPVKSTFGVPNEKWRRPLSPLHDRPPVTEYRYGSPQKVEPVKDSRVDNWHGPSSPIHDRPPKVEDFLTQVQTEASRPTRPLFSIMNWRNSTNAAGQNHVTDYRESPNNYTTSDWNKSSGDLIRDESFSEPYISNKEGWDWPGHKGWTMPPRQTNTSLSGPTNDSGKAMEVLTQAIKPSYVTPAAPQQRFTVPTSPVPKRETYTETIDSREAARRYGSFNLSSRPLQTNETDTGTIDSREAEQKYNGARVP
ncbi:hypothetical protein Acr_15g0014410 [Actinidia rufa]|uniref:Uncharacterized protein n=1 Tax=Actinidia rufa TaxID=165716 RepID=A0A7J0FVV5_9ERIC|nr:hypothetical protein Acr_15g0014410 [Actinidia rufa]